MPVSSCFSIVIALRLHPNGHRDHRPGGMGRCQTCVEFRHATAKVAANIPHGNAIMSDLETFRRETRVWLEANCPPEMRRPMTSENDTYWGGRNAKFSSEPQRVWFERMRDKGWTVPDWPKEYGGGGVDLGRDTGAWHGQLAS